MFKIYYTKLISTYPLQTSNFQILNGLNGRLIAKYNFFSIAIETWSILLRYKVIMWNLCELSKDLMVKIECNDLNGYCGNYRKKETANTFNQDIIKHDITCQTCLNA